MPLHQSYQQQVLNILWLRQSLPVEKKMFCDFLSQSDTDKQDW